MVSQFIIAVIMKMMIFFPPRGKNESCIFKHIFLDFQKLSSFLYSVAVVDTHYRGRPFYVTE